MRRTNFKLFQQKSKITEENESEQTDRSVG